MYVTYVPYSHVFEEFLRGPGGGADQSDILVGCGPYILHLIIQLL